MKNKNPNMLVRIAMADAYGMGAEYLKKEDDLILQEVMKFERYVAHPRHSSGAGKYTDDTEMSIANIFVILAKEYPTKRDFADAYVKEFNFGGRRLGYSKGFQVLLEKVKTGSELLEVLHPDSDKNGAAMRAVPFGVYPNISKVLQVATISASVTHDTDIGRFGSRAVALASHFSLYKDLPFSELRDYLFWNLYHEDRQFSSILFDAWDGSPVVGGSRGSVGLTTISAVLELLEEENSLMDMLKKAVSWGGDVDSVAAIAWGIASARFQNEELPDFLTHQLEFGSSKTGHERLLNLGTELMNRV